MSRQQPYGYPAIPQTQVLVQPYRCSTAHIVIAWVLAALTGLYLLPWDVSATRNRSNVAATAMVNLFLGWTVVGWVVALVMACGSERPAVVVLQTYGPPPQPWAATPPPALRAAPSRSTYRPSPAEPTMIDPFGVEPTQQLPHSPWEPDHRR